MIHLLNPLNGKPIHDPLSTGEPSRLQLVAMFILHRILSSALVEIDLVGASVPPTEQENQTEDDGKVNQMVQPNSESIKTMKIAQLEGLAAEWMRPIQKIINVYKHKEPIDDSPISEFKLWQMQEIEFKNILENMKHPFVIAVQSKF